MHQAVKVACALLDLLPHVVVDFHVKDIGHQIECILVILHFCVQSSQVEAIREVILVDFAEVFIAACRYELECCQQSSRLKSPASLDKSLGVAKAGCG
jgi:hypothetical protein